MAKAKKPESTKPAAPKKAAQSKSPSNSPATSAAGQPMVNTSFAASAAARMLASGHKTGSASSGNKSESAMFKQLKANVSKPHAAGLDNVLDKSAPATSKKSNLPFTGPGGSKQVGHNQTFGADVTRSGVPRRTAG